MTRRKSATETSLQLQTSRASDLGKAEGWQMDSEGAEKPTSEQLEKLDAKIAKSHTEYIKSVAGPSPDYCPATIKKVVIKENHLSILIHFPFLLPRMWPFPRKDLEQFRDFLTRKKNQTLLSNFFYQQLVRFISSKFELKKASDYLKRRVREIPQRLLAGRPTHRISRKLARDTATEGKAIHDVVCAMRDFVLDMQKDQNILSHAVVRTKIQRKYSRAKYPWLKHFFGLCEQLPRRRYSSSRAAETDFSGSADSSGKRLPCDLTEPAEWSTMDIATKILQQKLFLQFGVRYPHLKLKALIESE